MDGDGLGVVPAHTYARLRFDDAAEQAVTHLSNVLQWHQGSPYAGQFVSQAEPRAGACRFPGSRPRGIARDRVARNNRGSIPRPARDADARGRSRRRSSRARPP